MLIRETQSKHSLFFVLFFGRFMSYDLAALENIPFKTR